MCQIDANKISDVYKQERNERLAYAALVLVPQIKKQQELRENQEKHWKGCRG